MLRRLLAPVVVVVCALACADTVRAPATRSLEPPPAPLSALDYDFSLDDGLSVLSARVCMRGSAPEWLVYGAEAGASFLRSPRVVDDAGRARPLRVDQGRVLLDGVGPDSCIAYEVDLAAALDRDSLLLAYPGDGALVTSAELFLYRPVERPAGLRSRARFHLPQGMDVSVPWERSEDAYVLDERAFAFTAHVAFGRLARQSLAAEGARIELVLLPGFAEPARAALAEWIETAANVVAGATGTFPAPYAQVIVAPTAPSPQAIRFGHTGRGGAPSILIFMPTDVDAGSLRGDFIAVHEFCHLLHPFVDRRDAWLSEGLATYLQEVLRVRAGLLSASDAWRRIYQGAWLGREAQGTLLDETRIMPVAHNYQRVYWAGAAIALLADVELRRRTENRVTLDTVLARLSSERAAALRPQRAAELLSKMDALAGTNVFEETASRHLQAPRFPQLDGLFAELGLSPDGRSLSVTPEGAAASAKLAWVRDAIMLHLVAKP